jgi:hypothetical protein
MIMMVDHHEPLHVKPKDTVVIGRAYVRPRLDVPAPSGVRF